MFCFIFFLPIQVLWLTWKLTPIVYPYFVRVCKLWGKFWGGNTKTHAFPIFSCQNFVDFSCFWFFFSSHFYRVLCCAAVTWYELTVSLSFSLTTRKHLITLTIVFLVTYLRLVLEGFMILTFNSTLFPKCHFYKWQLCDTDHWRSV